MYFKLSKLKAKLIFFGQSKLQFETFLECYSLDQLFCTLSRENPRIPVKIDIAGAEVVTAPLAIDS